MIEGKRKNAFLRRATFFTATRVIAVGLTPTGITMGNMEVNDKQSAILTHHPELFLPIQIGVAALALLVLYTFEQWSSRRLKLGDTSNAQFGKRAATGLFYALNIASAFDAANDISTLTFGTNFI